MKTFLRDVSIQIGAVIALAVVLVVTMLALGKFVPLSLF